MQAGPVAAVISYFMRGSQCNHKLVNATFSCTLHALARWESCISNLNGSEEGLLQRSQHVWLLFVVLITCVVRPFVVLNSDYVVPIAPVYMNPCNPPIETTALLRMSDCQSVRRQ